MLYISYDFVYFSLDSMFIIIQDRNGMNVTYHKTVICFNMKQPAIFWKSKSRILQTPFEYNVILTPG